MAFRVQIRRDPSGKWIVNNPILLDGEFGYETDTTFLKIGDGATTWNYLPYWEGGQGPVGPTGASGATYKVFTALLTQNGGDSGGLYVYANAPTVIGVTYTININNDNLADFTNIGAPNNNVGTKFIATGTTPANWGTLAELEYNTGAPVATVLENTIGNVWFTYNSADLYFINGFEKFTIGKFWAVSGPVLGDTMFLPTEISNVNPNYASISYVKDGVTQNGYLNRTPIEIRVYN